MAYTQAEYDALKKAIGSGAQSVYYGDKRVDYRSLDQMKTILADMAAEIGITQRKSRRVLTKFSKGLQ